MSIGCSSRGPELSPSSHWTAGMSGPCLVTISFCCCWHSTCASLCLPLRPCTAAPALWLGCFLGSISFRVSLFPVTHHLCSLCYNWPCFSFHDSKAHSFSAATHYSRSQRSLEAEVSPSLLRGSLAQLTQLFLKATPGSSIVCPKHTYLLCEYEINSLSLVK